MHQTAHHAKSVIYTSVFNNDNLLVYNWNTPGILLVYTMCKNGL